MTTNEDLDFIVNEYLRRLEVALVGLPPERRRQLVESISDHITEARATLSVTSEVALRDILDRVGRPDDIAEAALADEAPSPRPQVSATRRGMLAGISVAIIIVAVLSVFLMTRSNNGSPTTSTSATTSTNALVSTAVPNVVGQTLAAAESELAMARFTSSVVFSCTGSKVPGVVKAQAPVSGSLAAQGTQVRLIVTPPQRCP